MLEDRTTRNALIFFLLFLSLVAFFMYSSPRRTPVSTAETGEEQKQEKAQVQDTSKIVKENYRKIESEVGQLEFDNYLQKENFRTAVRYRTIRERRNREGELKEQLSERVFRAGGEILGKGIEYYNNGNYDQAIDTLRAFIAQAGNEKALQAGGYFYLGKAYQAKQDIPRYCICMYKYFNLLEELEKDENRLKKISAIKEQFEQSIAALKSKGYIK